VDGMGYALLLKRNEGIQEKWERKGGEKIKEISNNKDKKKRYKSGGIYGCQVQQATVV